MSMKKLLLTIVAVLLPIIASAQGRNPSADLQNVGPTRQADDGRYFCAMTQTPGTAYNLTGATQNAFSATTATWTIKNSLAAGTNTNIYLDFAKIVFASAGTAGTRVEVAVALDDTTRYSSGGTAVSIKNVNMGSSTASIATVNAGDITATAAGANVRYVGRGTLSTAIPAVGETYTLSFGTVEVVSATHINKTLTLPPVVLAPATSAVIHTWLPSQSAAPTGELLICWWER